MYMVKVNFCKSGLGNNTSSLMIDNFKQFNWKTFGKKSINTKCTS